MKEVSKNPQDLIDKNRKNREEGKNHHYIVPGHIVEEDTKNQNSFLGESIHNIDKEPEPFSLSGYYLG